MKQCWAVPDFGTTTQTDAGRDRFLSYPPRTTCTSLRDFCFSETCVHLDHLEGQGLHLGENWIITAFSLAVLHDEHYLLGFQLPVLKFMKSVPQFNELS